MNVYTFDTNAGPIVQLHASSLSVAKKRAEAQVPLLRKRGYTCSWIVSTAKGWHVCSVFNSKGRRVHQFAIRKGWK